MRVLLSGFGDFLDVTSNPSRELVHELAARLASFDLMAIELPVSYERAFSELKKSADKFNPHIILCFGVATDRSEINIERVAINAKDAKGEDVDGVSYGGEKIDQAGADGLFTDLDLNSLNSAGLVTSNTAGTYVCNTLFYQCLNEFKDSQVKCGFIHIPPFEKSSLEDQLRVLSPVISQYLSLEL
jgi:pyroglutamyl-peptidase